MSLAEPSNASMLSVVPAACWNATDDHVAVAGEELAEDGVVLERRAGAAMVDHYRTLPIERPGVTNLHAVGVRHRRSRSRLSRSPIASDDVSSSSFRTTCRS